MKRSTGLSLIAATFMLLGFGCLESPEVRAARLEQQRLMAQKARRARSATYNLPKNRVWAALYALVLADYEIKRESETRGYIETDWRDDSDMRKSQLEAEVVGDDTIRVVIKVQTQARSRKFDWSQMKDVITEWSGVHRWTEKEDELYVKLWEQLQGE